MKGSRILGPLFFLAIILQAALLYFGHVPELRPLKGDEGRYQMKALQIASGKYPDQDFLWPPLYPYILGGIYSIFGVKRFAVELFQILLFFISGYILFRLIIFAGLGEIAAGSALFLFLLDPQIASFAQYLWPEILHLFFLFAMLGLIFLVSGKKLLALFGAGLFLGAAILTKSLLTPFVPVLIVVAAFRVSGTTVAPRIIAAGVFGFGICLLVLPLVIYNGVRHGFWGVADAASFNLWLGLKGDVYAAQEFNEYQKLSEMPIERNKILREQVARKIDQEGIWNILVAQSKRQYFRLFSKESFLTEQFPGKRWARNSLPHGWLVVLLTWWSFVIYATTLATGSMGLFQIRWRTDFKRCILPLLFILYNLGLFLFFYAKTRYRIPFLPAFIFFSALSIHYFLENRKRSGSIPVPGLRFAAGCILGAIFLWFAFVPEPA
jgi:4-amino-4-deoxy-L-arabinose transferase-like glycosyltransferase